MESNSVMCPAEFGTRAAAAAPTTAHREMPLRTAIGARICLSQDSPNARRFRKSLAGTTRRQSTSMGRPIAMGAVCGCPSAISSDNRSAGLAHPHRTRAFLARCRSGRCSCEHRRGMAVQSRVEDPHAKTPGRFGDRALRDQHHVSRVVARHAVGLHPGEHVAGLRVGQPRRSVSSRRAAHCGPGHERGVKVFGQRPLAGRSDRRRAAWALCASGWTTINPEQSTSQIACWALSMCVLWLYRVFG